MKLYMPKILFPALNLPLDADVIVEIDYIKNQELVENMINKGWVAEE